MKMQSDIELLKGLIDGDKNIEEAFLNKYRGQIYRTFTNVHEKMKLRTPLTSDLKDELLAALCENIRASKDKLEEEISDGRRFNLSAHLETRASFFCQSKLLVNALKKRDESVTKRVFYGDKNDKISLRPIIINILNEKQICDLDDPRKRLSAEDVMPKVYELLMKQLDQDKFRFICSLKTFFARSIMRTFLSDYYKELEHRRKIDIDIESFDSTNEFEVIDIVAFEKEKCVDYFEGLFDYMTTHGVTERDIGILRDRFLEEMSYEEIADKWMETKSNVGVIINRTRKKMIAASAEYGYDWDF